MGVLDKVHAHCNNATKQKGSVSSTKVAVQWCHNSTTLASVVTHQRLLCQQLLSLEPVHSEPTYGCGSLHCPQLMMAPEDTQITARIHQNTSDVSTVSNMSSGLATCPLQLQDVRCLSQHVASFWQHVNKQTVCNPVHIKCMPYTHTDHLENTKHRTTPASKSLAAISHKARADSSTTGSLL